VTLIITYGKTEIKISSKSVGFLSFDVSNKKETYMLYKNIPWDLLISHLKEETTQEQEEALINWREKDSNNDLYNEIKELWQEIIRNAAFYSPDTEHYWKLLETRMEQIEKKKRVKLSFSLNKFRIAIAAASVLLIVAVSLSFLIGKNTSRDISTQTYKALSGKSEMLLPDGSTVWLNKGSILTFETSFLKNRMIKLSGEALFDVKKDVDNPFIVSTDGVKVKVEGTRFNVQAYPAENDIRVALLEGKVSVFSNNDIFYMAPGEIASYSKASQQLILENGDVGFEAFWADRSCYFDKKTLSYICKYLERWYNIEIDLDSTIADSQVYTFTITDEPLEIILQIMSGINPIRYSFDDEKRVSIKSVQLIK